MTENLREGLEIVGVGVGGVFLNLLVLMVMIQLVGLVFGKKKAAAKAQPEKK